MPIPNITKYFTSTIILSGLIATIIFNTLYNSKAILALLICGILISLQNIFQKNWIQININLYVIGYLLISLISYYFSTTANLGLYELSLDWIVWIIFLSIIFIKDKKFQPLYLGIGVICILESIVGLSQIITRDETRIAGTFFSWLTKAEFYPNAFALFLLLSSPFIHKFKQKYLFFITVFLSTSALLFSFSRGALLVYFLQIAIFTMFYLKNKEYKIFTNYVSAIIIAFITFVSFNQFQASQNPTKIESNLSAKYTFSGSEKLTSVNERAQFFSGSFKLISQKPLLGHGIDSFSYVYPHIQPLFLANAPHPHNLFLKIGAERGLISLFFYLMIIGNLLFLMLKNSKKILESKTLTILSVSFIAGILHNLIDYNFNFASNLMLFTISAAILYKSLTDLVHTKIKTYLSLFLLISICTVPFFWLFQEYRFTSAKEYYQSQPAIAKQFLYNLNYKNSNLLLSDLESNPTQKLATLNSQIQINKFDAFAFNKIGDLQTETKLKNQAYNKAKNADPMNFWVFYYNYYSTSGTQKLIADQNKIQIKLEQYLQLAKQNIHYTAQQDNIIQAQRLANLFFKTTKNSKFQKIEADLLTAQEIFGSN